MGTIILIVILIAVGYFIFKRRKSKTDATPITTTNTTSSIRFDVGPAITQESNIGDNRAEMLDDLIANDNTGKLATTANMLYKVFSPDKNGDFNDAKKCGKALAEAEATVSDTLGKGSDSYVSFFILVYDRILASMMASGNKKLIDTAKYTLEQADEYYQRGKCQTFVNGLHPDGLAARAEILMAINEKCWFGNIKTTMFRKDMEKRTLPTAAQ